MVTFNTIRSLEQAKGLGLLLKFNYNEKPRAGRIHKLNDKNVTLAMVGGGFRTFDVLKLQTSGYSMV